MMAQSAKPMPNLDQHQQSTRVLNLTVLQRIDPFVEEILITAAHVTFYEFNIELNQWSRKDVEGSLFVVKRNTQPRFQFIVMNRRNTDNLVEDLLGDFEFEVQVPYLLYRNGAQEVNGIWFYNKQDCEAVATLFTRINNAFSKVHPKPKVASAKSEFEELEAVPSLSVIEGPLEPLVSSAAKPVPDDSFTNFFSAAVNVSNPSNAPNAALESSATISSSSHTPGVAPSSVPSLETALSLPKSTPSMPLLNTHEPSGAGGNHTTNLVKPSFFSPPSSGLLTLPPVSTSMPTAPPLHPPVTMQRPYGTPLLQPFPPPTPSPSLTPAQTYGPIITREKVCDALLRLVQDNNFIDMVYWELLNAHNS